MLSIEIYEGYTLYENGDVISNRTGKRLKPMLNKSGYCRVAVYVKKERKFIFNHIKVVEYFGDCKGNKIPKYASKLRDLKLSIDHIDRNKLNNNRSNLELVSHSENCKRRFTTPPHHSI